MSFVDAHGFPVDLVLRVLGIAASTYYDWRARQAAPSRRQLDDAQLLEMIVKIRTSHEFAGTYGSPRVWLALRRQGIRCGRKRVERIMRTHGLQGAFLPKGWKSCSTRQNPRHSAAPDLVERDFTATGPNRLWVADLTRIMTGQGVLWLASVRDAFSNKVVGWACDSRADTDLVLAALNYALRSRDVQDGELIRHSDKGCQYTALRFTQRLADAGIALRRLAVSGTASITPWRRTCGRPLRPSCSTGPAPSSPPAPRPKPHFCATSTDGTTPAVSSKASAAWHPTSTRRHGTAKATQLSSTPSQNHPDNRVSGKPGEPQSTQPAHQPRTRPGC